MAPNRPSPSLCTVGIAREHLSANLFTAATPVKPQRRRGAVHRRRCRRRRYRVEEGLLKVSVITPGGAERILAILGAGPIVGELSMIDGSARSASVSALRDSKLSFVSRSNFEAFAGSNPEMFQHLMVLLARRLRDTNNALAATSFLSVKGRVARALLDLAEAFGHDVGGGRILVRQKVTQSDLGAMAGIARENVSRILKEWTDHKVVSRLAGYYCLENKARLEHEAEL